MFVYYNELFVHSITIKRLVLKKSTFSVTCFLIFILSNSLYLLQVCMHVLLLWKYFGFVLFRLFSIVRISLCLIRLYNVMMCVS